MTDVKVPNEGSNLGTLIPEIWFVVPVTLADFTCVLVAVLMVESVLNE